MIKEEHLNKLLDIYDKDKKYKFNERYSKGGNGMVFTKPDDKWHWLVFDNVSKDQIEVRRTDDTGRITSKDRFVIIGDDFVKTDRVCFKDKLNEMKAKTDTINAKREKGAKLNEIGR